MALSPEQRAHWDREGFLLLPGFFSDAQVRVLEESYHRAWRERGHVTIDNLTLELRLKLADASAESRARDLFKLNDLYLEFEDLRAVSLDPRIVEILTELLGHAPVLCNTLSLERSTQQQNHIDSFYMTPRTRGHLAATWVALEDVHPDAGPLRYVPGSHLIPPFTFADGTHHATADEHDDADAHFAREIAALQLRPQRLCAKKGDAFIWNADLVHGGEPIHDRKRTRKSFVSHFYTEPDVRAWKLDLVPHGKGWWIHRGHQPVEAPVAPAAPAPAPAPPAAPVVPLRYQLVDKVYFGVKRAMPAGVAAAAKQLLARFL